MSHSKTTKRRRITSWIMTLIMIFSLLPSNLALKLGLTQRAEAAYSDDLEAQGGLREKIVQNAAKYLGYGYSQERRGNDDYHCFDCSSLVSRVLLDSGVVITTGYNGGAGDPLSSSTWATHNWSTSGYQYGIEHQSLAITYNGKTYTGANGGIVYCSTVATYNAAVANAANSGKFVILTTPQMSTQLTQKPGTILLHPYDAATDSAAHMAIVAGSVTPNFTLKAGGEGSSG